MHRSIWVLLISPHPSVVASKITQRTTGTTITTAVATDEHEREGFRGGSTPGTAAPQPPGMRLVEGTGRGGGGA